MYSSILYRFLCYLMLNTIVTLKARLRITQDHWKWHHAKACVRFPSIVGLNMALTCIISEIKRDIGRKLLFFTTQLHSTPISGSPLIGSPPEYCYNVWYRKARMVGLPDGKNILKICSACVGRIPACDRPTDGQTSCDSLVHAMHTRRAVIKPYERDKQGDNHLKQPMTLVIKYFSNQYSCIL